MNERIKRLREQTLTAIPEISIERGSLLTEFYQSGRSEQVSVPVARALAFKYLLEHKTICINPDELIVGERGPAPKATPTYPEICTHSIADLEILDTRAKIPFRVSNEVKKTQKHFINPFWRGRAMRDRIMAEVDEDWKNAYAAGVFTEFMEQRAPGHTVCDDKIYQKGMLDFQQDIQDSLDKLDFSNDPRALDKREELQAMSIAAEALIYFANRHADLAEQLAVAETDPMRQAELENITKICRKIPAHKPESFYEALQYYWFVHLGVITELNTWDSFNPGRLDQHLLPFYLQGLEDDSLTEESARELLQAFWIKFNNQPAPPKVGITAKESNTYTDFCLINLGGLTAQGQDATNELSYLILDVIEEMRLLQPSSMVQISKKSPDKLLKRALRIIKTGYGQPSLFNTDAIVAELIRQGKSIQDARSGGASGCVEAGAFGKEAYILTGYFNIPKVLEITLNNGFDRQTDKQIGPETGKPEDYQNFDDLYSAFESQLQHFINIKLKGNLIIERLWAKYLP
ncbi:MAG: formate C-acetyltransferase/glycerol dehydratase family glycyl radical enzyme, partial [Candidatus Marinimicrobia bacterium]|nr:formate C-acetyltransferase/glycerol dehydratase family glycyl radical enzyme [Candidatus Neomarinimicrobiota bacterium]